MTSDPNQEWRSEKERSDLEVYFPDQNKLVPGLDDEDCLSEFLRVVQIGPRRWRIMESPVFSEAVTWGDIVEADIEERCLVIKRFAEPSRFRTIRTGVPHMFYFSDFGKAFLDRVIELGGMWEIIFWGILILNLPKELAEDLEEMFDAACKEAISLGNIERTLPNKLFRQRPEGGAGQTEGGN